MQTNNLPQTIKDKVSITDVIGGYVRLEQSGGNYKARCPFHNERTPSFYISPDRGTYYCFGCGAKGDIFSFIQQFEGLDFRGALKVLADRAGVSLTEGYSIPREKDDDIYDIMEEATKYFQSQLKSNQEAQEYVKGRGLTEQTIARFRIGYAPKEWRSVSEHLKKLKFTDAQLEKAGLIKRVTATEGPKQEKVYDRFRDRIMFPLTDSSGRTIAFSGRILHPDDKAPKYLNSPDTPLFDKSKTLFGIDKAKQSIHKMGYAILVEGQMDVVMSHQAGLSNTVGISGTALSDELQADEKRVTNLGLLRRLTPHLKLALDTDKAGIKATLRSAQVALSLGMDVKIAVMAGKDPADVIKENPETYKEALKKSLPLIEYVIWSVQQQHKDKRMQDKALRLEVMPYLAAIDSPIERAQQVHLVAQALSVQDNAVMDELKKHIAIQKSSVKPQQPVTEKTNAQPIYDRMLRHLFGIILCTEEKHTWAVFSKKAEREVQEILGSQYESYKAIFEQAINDIRFELEVFYTNWTAAQIENDVNEMLERFRQDFAKQRMTELVHALSIAEKNKDEEKIIELVAKVNALMKQAGKK